MNRTHEIELAWAAGLFVGEGCVRNEGGARNSTTICMSINMYDGEAVKRFIKAVKPYADKADAEYFGRGRNKPLVARKGRVKRKTLANPEYHYVECWYFRTRQGKSIAIARALYPYLKGTAKGKQMEDTFQKAGVELCPAN